MCISLFKRKEIPKIGKNGTKLTLKSFNSKTAPRNLLKLGLYLYLTLLNTTVKYEFNNFCTSLFKRKEIPKIGKNGTKLTLKSFNSKTAPRNLLKLGLKLHLTLLNTTVKHEYKNFCTSLLKRKEIPKIGKNGTKLIYSNLFKFFNHFLISFALHQSFVFLNN